MLTALVFLIIRKWWKFRKLTKIVKTEEKNQSSYLLNDLLNFNEAYGRNFNLQLLIISKVTKKQKSIILIKNKFFEKPSKRFKLRGSNIKNSIKYLFTCFHLVEMRMGYSPLFSATSREGLSNNTFLHISKMFHPIFPGAIEH